MSRSEWRDIVDVNIMLVMDMMAVMMMLVMELVVMVVLVIEMLVIGVREGVKKNFFFFRKKS